MTIGQTLIDKAKELGYTRYRIAKEINVSQGHLSKVCRGAKISPKMSAMLAKFAGVDAEKAAIYAIIEDAENERERQFLKQLFQIEDTPEGVLKR